MIKDNYGLSDKQVIKNRKKYGTNELKKQKQKGFISLLIESMSDPIIKILLIALVVKVVFLFRDFDWFETLGILIAIFFASFISSVSEYGSEKAFNKLQEESSKIKCKVIRNGAISEIYIDEVVKEDLVVLEPGDKVCADGYIISGSVGIDESSINGESKEVLKEENDLVYRGTVVLSGSSKMIVKEVGENTFYGKIASELLEKNTDSPLKIRLRNLAKIISTFGYVGAFLASVSYLFSVIVVDNNFVLENIINTVTNFKIMADHIIYALTLCVTIIIVSVPEGLPMMITLVLSSNMKRMLKNGVLVRKMVGIETAGNINVLFTDKTGTLTTGDLSISKIISGSLKEYKNEEDVRKYSKYDEVLKLSLVSNNMSEYSNKKIIGGNATDKCLLSFYKETKVDIVKLKTIAFDSKNKYMITVINNLNYKNLIKGAPEVLLKNCKYYINEYGRKELFLNKNKIEKLIDENTKNGMRAILLATSNLVTENLFKDITFIGVVFIKDVIRKEVVMSLNQVKEAGINTIMITGDSKKTALCIAKEIGLVKTEKDLVITSEELGKLSDLELKKIISNLKVVARSMPQDKSRLVRAAQEMNLIVGMTGDGVNDAPALKKADVGFAMGTGSEVAKEASDIVILDNNFLSISKAVLYGRTIFKSIRKFVIFQITVNLCALSISIIGPFIGIDTPVTVIQMLWINMVMDTLAGLAFAFEPPLKEYMKQKPKKISDGIMNGYMINEILITGLYTIILLLLFLKLPVIRAKYSSYESYMTAFFGLFIFSGIFNCFNAHTSRINIFSNINKNKIFTMVITFIIIVQIFMMYFGGKTFRTVPISFNEFIIMFILSLTVIPIDILRKVLCKKFGKSRDV